LRVASVIEDQAKLARRYGIGGFCFYYYWFAGKRLLEMPLNRMLETGRPDFPFCLCWANENWTRRWDGQDREILVAQAHSDQDDVNVIRDLIRYMRHVNYIRIRGRPLLLVYRVTQFPNFARTASVWRDVCRREGLGEIYLALVESFELVHSTPDPAVFGCDASVEFPPHGLAKPVATPEPKLNAEFDGRVCDYRELVVTYCLRDEPSFIRFRSVVPGWDNTARRQNHSFSFDLATPGAFQAWAEFVIDRTRALRSSDERIIFVNAWNEWAEGAYLEPDQRFGHSYLEALKNALDASIFARTYALD
jgi:lipopolysaccharide biosynthesis protein